MSVDARHKQVQPPEIATCDVPPGDYVLCAVIDPDCEIEESRDDDNTVYSDYLFKVTASSSDACGTGPLNITNCGDPYADLAEIEPDAHDCFADPSPADCDTTVADYEMLDVGTLEGNTSSRANRYQSAVIGAHPDGTGLADASVRFVAPATDTYVFDTTGSSFDAGFFGVSDLTGTTELDTAASGWYQGYVGAHLSRALTAGEVLYFVIDGDPRGAVEVPFDSAGAFAFNVAYAELTEQGCDDRRDLDDDGLLDCDDTDCWLDAACAEVCDNDADDNADGRIDCVDPICGADPACPSTCPAYMVDTTAPTVGTTSGDLDHSQGTCATIYGEEDSTAEFTAPAGGTYVFDTVGSAHHPGALYLLDACGGAELTCGGVVSSSVTDAWNQIVWPLGAGETVVVVVDGVPDGAFTINVGAWELTESDCADGRDLDDDGAADCLDSDCTADPFCLEQCDDALDNDLDGEVDCLDPDCDLDLACVEDCDNGVDDNANGLVDCDDTASCFDDPPCDAFDYHVNVLGAAIVEGDLSQMTDDWDCSCATASGGAGGDATIRYTSPVTGEIVFDLVDGGDLTPRPALCVFDELGGTELACDLHGNYGAQVVLSVTAGEVVTLVVEANRVPTDEGPFVLNVAELELAEAVCDDYRDLDDDAWVDCADSDCDEAEVCTETGWECTDFWDNDEDSWYDCEDPDCIAEAVFCENCDNGVDDDGDGDVDCDDFGYPGCYDIAGADICWEDTCFGGVDDDGDGLTDCVDPDCVDDWECW